MAIVFYSKTPEYAWLSNFSPHGFELNGLHWPSVEHYYQAQKYAGTPVAEQIRLAENAPKARSLGQHRSFTVRPDWETVKKTIMHQALQAKFSQNRKLRQQLLATGDELLIHHSPKDLYWGWGEKGEGKNYLGLLIMEVRASLRSRSISGGESSEAIPGFTLSSNA
jgi:ribA/ribD-fused uncharacterized protein